MPSWRKQYNELLFTLRAYQSAVNAAAIVSITDIEGKIIYVNDKFVEVSKYPASELIGQKHRIINSDYHPSIFFKEMWKTIRQGHHWRGEIKNKAKDGTYYWVDTIITPVLDENNKVFQFLSVRNLITAQKENEEKLIRVQEELLKREKQLNDAQQVVKTGSWYMHFPGHSIEWSEETYRIFEIPSGTPVSYELFLEKVHPADREFVHKSWQAALGGSPYEIEHRIITYSGEKWVSEKASLEFDSSRSLTKALGTVQDITDKKRTEEALKESETLYKSLFNNSPFPVGILDKETMQFMEVNDTAVSLYGYPKDEFLRLTAYDIRVPEQHDKLKEQLAGGNYIWDRTIRSHRKKNGEIIYIEPYITEISYKGKQAYLITINNVTEKLRLQEQLIQSKITRQKEINRASMEAQEKNRAEIGRELHDNVNQLLVASNLYLKHVSPVSDKDKEYLGKSIRITTEAIQEIRKLSWSLVPPALNDLSLKDAIENLSQNFALTQTLVEFDINLCEETLEEGLKINLYRIIQEQFSNIIKYAAASKVKIIMKQQPGLLTLEITDNGKGFDPKQTAKGIGLTNILHRAETYNGKVCIDSSLGNGCRIYLEFITAQ
ncbi:MAG: PAS domain S-box protein [Chitinophagaceae bacterium]|nr:PAS domain S-box protein [Chitinophagaceae bacterium]